MKKDRINERILQALKRNGRISNTELADEVGLSPSACLRRVQDLEKSGVISGYRAILNNRVLGLGFIAYIAVALRDHSTESQLKFERAIAEAPEVIECHNITGEAEYLLRVETEDLVHYKRFHSETLGEIPQIRNIHTYVVLSSPKDERG